MRFFVEIFGHYPEKIDQESIARDSSSLRTSENLIDAQRRLRKEKNIMQSIQSIGLFYKVLVDMGNDSAYYGDKVSPDSPDAVLMRWKTHDGRYRVVFGDLQTRDVTSEELAELERP